jgi:poly-gamma-glutamate synthesis protein (capsule biosynthesis protein)
MPLRATIGYACLIFCTLLLGSGDAGAACSPHCPTDPIPAQYRDAELFAKAIAAAERPAPARMTLSGITVPHHLLAADLIARGLRMADPASVRKVVVLMPDHFKRTALAFATTRRDFATVFGLVRTDRDDVGRLLELSDMVEESGLFTHEHAIGAVVPFIRHYFPDARVVPIAISFRSRRADWDRLVERLEPMIDGDTIVVQSTDFSHYLPLAAAVRRDQEALNVLGAGDLEAAAAFRQPAHTDSRGAQYIQLRVQHDVFHANPMVVFNSNSQAYSTEPEAQTTSYIVQVYPRSPLRQIGPELPGSRIYCFAGDTFFGRDVARALARPGVEERIRSEIASVLNNCRLVLNLEGVVLPKVPNDLGPTTLGMPLDLTLAGLRALHVRAVSVANNHAMDFGLEPYRRMVRRLRAAGIVVLRHGEVVDLGAFRAVALSDLDNHTGRTSGVVSERSIDAIRRGRARGPVVAFMHWGRERVAAHGDRQRMLAEDLASAGITLVVGAHPHVRSTKLDLVAGATGLEAYSLGNFIFDQSAARASGSLLEVRVFQQGTLATRLVPIPNFFDRATGHAARAD